MEKVVHLSPGCSTRVLDTGGDGPIVVLVHGLGHSIEIWERVLPVLAASFRVVAFDMPGFGASDRPDAAYDGQFFALCLLRVLDVLGLDRVHLVGNSLGATAIVHLSGIAPDRIDRVVLAAPGGFDRRVHPIMRLVGLPVLGPVLCWPTPAANRVTMAVSFEDRDAVTPRLRRTIDGHLSRPGAGRAFVRALRSGVGLRGARDVESVLRLARGFSRPVLVVWGGRDRIFPVAAGRRAVEEMPDARLSLVPECGHHPQWEKADAFGALVVGFLSSAWSG